MSFILKEAEYDQIMERAREFKMVCVKVNFKILEL